MLRCQQVNRNEIWIRIPVCVEIDRRFDVGPFCLGYRRISMQEIIESQTGPPCDCAPTFDVYETSNLVMDLVACAKRLARFVGPHLMSGNVMLLKHAPGVPQCAVAFEQVLKDAGVPVGVYTNLFLSNDQ